MRQYSYLFSVASGLPLTWLAVTSFAVAQVTPDGTLGTRVNGSLTSPCTGVCIITDGITRGGNLFHSLNQFSLPNNDVATFLTIPTIQNVIVRITGLGEPFISNINGTIQTSSSINFFLLNPNGIVFGPGVRLNIGGSFLATTASSMHFQDGTQFKTTAPTPLLTVSAPIGLEFTEVPKNIRMQSSSLSAEQNSNFSNFALVGGDILLNDTSIQTTNNRVELGD